MKLSKAKVFAITGFKKLGKKEFPIESKTTVEVPVSIKNGRIAKIREMWKEASAKFRAKGVKFKTLSYNTEILGK